MNQLGFCQGLFKALNFEFEILKKPGARGRALNPSCSRSSAPQLVANILKPEEAA